MRKYFNHDERFGEACEFTIPEMIEQYRAAGWDEYQDENGNICTMTDTEIEEDILDHDIEEIT